MLQNFKDLASIINKEAGVNATEQLYGRFRAFETEGEQCVNELSGDYIVFVFICSSYDD